MSSRQIRNLATELSARLFEREFLKAAGISRRTMQDIFEREKWEKVFEQVFPIKGRFTCAEILEMCRPELSQICNEPEEGWISATYKYVTHILYPDPEYTRAAAPYAAGALFFLRLMQFFFDEERKVVPFDPFHDFALLKKNILSASEPRNMITLFGSSVSSMFMR